MSGTPANLRPCSPLTSNIIPPLPPSMGSRLESRVRFYEPSDEECPGNGINPPTLPAPTPVHTQSRRSDSEDLSGAPQWHYPVYTGVPRHEATQIDTEMHPHQISHAPISPTNGHRESDATLYSISSQSPEKGGQKRCSMSSDMPHATPSRQPSVTSVPDIPPLHLAPRHSISPTESLMPDDEEESELRRVIPPEKRDMRRGVLSNLFEYHHVDNDPLYDEDDGGDPPMMRPINSGDSITSEFYPEENPLHEIRLKDLESQRNSDEKDKDEEKKKTVGVDPRDVEYTRIARLNHHQRRKEATKAVIEHNITCACLISTFELISNVVLQRCLIDNASCVCFPGPFSIFLHHHIGWKPSLSLQLRPLT